MVESETAGVVFTINPASGKKEEMLINASYGLGESVVSGVVSPDELVCDRLGNVIKVSDRSQGNAGCLRRKTDGYRACCRGKKKQTFSF